MGAMRGLTIAALAAVGFVLLLGAACMLQGDELSCARARRVEVQVMRADGRPHVTADGTRIPISPEVLLPDGCTVYPEHGAAAHA